MIGLPRFPVPDFSPALPEILLAAGALALLTLGASRGQAAQRLIETLAMLLLMVVFLVVVLGDPARVVTFADAFIHDGFSRFAKALILAGALAGLLFSLEYFRVRKAERFEYPILILLATVGMMMMVSAHDLLALYLGLELQALALYVAASIQRDDARSSEAGLKYFVLGALSSGMLLYGASMIYGFTGTLNFEGIAAALRGEGGTGAVFGLVFVVAGLAFKVSAAPFHMWTPDVYEGSPTPVTAFFAGAPKVAAMALFVRVLIDAFPSVTPQWQQILAFLAVISMVLGALAAIGQQSLKRLLAYSSIGNMGYALVGLSAGHAEGVQGVLVFLAIYLAMTVGIFAAVLALRTDRGHVETIGELAGLARTRPGIAFALAMLMFSMIGVPPLAGFFGKFYVFAAAIKAGLYWLAVIGIVASVVSAFYYLRIVKVMYMDEPTTSHSIGAVEVRAVLGASFTVVFLFAIVAGPLVAAAGAAARSLF